jgi:hypothetical protein
MLAGTGGLTSPAMSHSADTSSGAIAYAVVISVFR